MDACPICNYPLNTDDLKCPHCGAKLQRCPNCGSLTFLNNKKCPKCHSVLNENSQPLDDARAKAFNTLQVAGEKAQEKLLREQSQFTQYADTNSPKSFVLKAILAFLFYYLGFWIIGFIMNLIFRKEANEEKERTGKNPSGSGCLDLLLFVHVSLPLFFIFIGLLLLLFAPHIIYELLEGI